MKFNATLKLAVAVLVLAFAVWHLEQKLRKPLESRSAPFGDVRMDDVDYLEFERGDLRIECSRKSRGWFIDYPVRAPADTSMVARMLSMLEGLSIREVITEEQRAERDLVLADYGLEDPSISITVGSSYFRRELYIGNSAPVGDAVYVKFAEESAVYAVPGSLTSLVPVSLALFRDPHIISGDPVKVSRLELHQPGGFVQLVRRPDGWWIQQPFLARADAGIVESLLSKLFSLQASSYVWDPPVGDDGEEAVQRGALRDVYGFAEDVSPARIAVWLNGDEIGREVMFGKAVPDSQGQIYARRKALESIFAVSAESAPVAAVTAVDLRDKLIFPVEPTGVIELAIEQQDSRIVLHKDPKAGWMITEPVQWRADDDYVNQMISALAQLKVSSYEEGPAPENLAELRLATPSFRICLSTAACQQNAAGLSEGARKGLPECAKEMVSFGAADTNGLRYLSLIGGQLASMRGSEFAGIDPPRLADPLQYRERTVLSLPAASIRRIDLDVGREPIESIVVSSNGLWTCTSQSNCQVNANVVSDIMLLAANLEAIGFEKLNPKNLSGYGLEPPSVSLTLGLSGDKGIQKTIMLGFKSGTDGIYGLIQGQDLLLILHRNLAEMLSRSLLVPVAPATLKPDASPAKERQDRR